MSIVRKVVPMQVEQTAENRSKFIASTNQLARDGHVLEPRGIDTRAFLECGIVLFDHDQGQPVGKPVAVELAPDGSKLSIEIEWAPDGISADADRTRKLVKAGILRAGSVGFDPIDMEPLDRSRPGGGQHITRSELLEFSIVSVPADTGAVVTQRAAEDWKCGVSRDLPIQDSDEWDGAAAEASVFKWAGGDDFDPSKARKAFLAYNAAKPKERGSYKLPIAHIVDGRLTVPKGAIRAAASRLPQTQIPDSVKESASAVLDHYKEKAGMSKTNTGGDRAARTSFVRMAPTLKRELYHVSSLAYLLCQAGYLHDAALEEAEREGDGSKVPEMLLAALEEFVAAFKVQAAEEADELLAEAKSGHPDLADELVDGERAFVLAGKSLLSRALRRGIAMARAGRALSAANEKHLQRALKQHDRAMAHHKDLGKAHEAVGEQLEAAQAAHGKAKDSYDELGEALENVHNNYPDGEEHVARCMRAYKSMGRNLDAVSDAHTEAEDSHADVGDSHQALGRCMRSAHASVKSVVDGAAPGGEDSDSKDVQTSDGDEDAAGSTNSRASGNADLKRRQSELAEMHRRLS